MLSSDTSRADQTCLLCGTPLVLTQDTERYRRMQISVARCQCPTCHLGLQAAQPLGKDGETRPATSQERVFAELVSSYHEYVRSLQTDPEKMAAVQAVLAALL
jgi:hypothetical protein